MSTISEFDVGKESGGISVKIGHWCIPDEILKGIEHYYIPIFFFRSLVRLPLYHI